MVAIGLPFLLALGTTAVTAAAAQPRPSQPGTNGEAILSPAQARALSSDVTDKVIVVFRNQVAGLPDTLANAAERSIAVRRLQQGVLSDLAAVHARNVTSISLVNAVAATVSPGAAKLLAGNPAVAEVIPDAAIPRR